MSTLKRWNITERLDDVRLCVSELATNAIVHGAPLSSHFLVRLLLAGTLLRLEVRDSGDGLPAAVRAGSEDTGGRGLLLVGELADRWDVGERAVGKEVWSEFDLAGAAGSEERAGCDAHEPAVCRSDRLGVPAAGGRRDAQSGP